MTDHPITPPPELVKQWMIETYGAPVAPGEATTAIATLAAQWGADQELEACCQWISDDAEALRIARRPKPPSLAEKALEALDEADFGLTESEWPQRSESIRRALERLQELENE